MGGGSRRPRQTRPRTPGEDGLGMGWGVVEGWYREIRVEPEKLGLSYI